MTDIARLSPPQNPYIPHKVTLEVPDDARAKELELTDEEADQVLKDANLSRVNLKNVRAYRKLGKYLKKSGLIEYARGKLLGREETLEKARESMLALVTGSEEAPQEVRIAAAMAVNQIIKTENDTLKMGIELEKIHGELTSAGKTTNQAPPPGHLILMQADNIKVSEKAS